ncbi:MAG TPA: signal peptidase I [Candidatus Sulfotelmatobacter sp.]|nr:signal peptidase I [Candidatus Sulfotelmatobacter sp.]
MAPQTESDPPKPRPGWLQVIAVGRNPRVTLIRIAVLVVVCFVLFHYVLLPAQVDGISMYPTYKNRSINLINQLAYVWHEPSRGDVVAVRAWAGKHMMLMKRIIGLPGETVAFDNGRVLINGQPLDEPYETQPSSWTLPPVKLGPTEYFVVGDNRTMSPRDHTFGTVDRSRIVGKMLL